MSVPEIPANFFDASTHYTGPKLTDAMISAAEALLGYKLPAAYLLLLRIKNGGAPKRQCYPTKGTHWTDNHFKVTAICGIGGRWGIDSETLGSRHMIETGGFSNIGIFVGWTPTAGHDGVFLDYRNCGPQGEPSVILLDAESGDEQLLAPNFGAFLHALVDCRPYDEQTKKGQEEFNRQSKKGG